VHVDAAYGGYFGLIADALEERARRAYAAMGRADSIVIDPHKHGLQPYGCGCVLFRDPAEGRFYKHDSPYTYFTSKELHLGEISLECSRAGAAAVALWATQRLLPLVPGGEFAQGLAKGRRAAVELDRRLRADERFVTLADSLPRSQTRDRGHPSGLPELDIVVWAVRAETAEESSNRAQKVFDACAARGLHLALVQLPGKWFGAADGAKIEESTVTCLRSVLMKPEHEAWMGEIWGRLSAACGEVVRA
jgi:glutamate/tyrosine decarboxylase-like PLP-dependent enzyme